MIVSLSTVVLHYGGSGGGAVHPIKWKADYPEISAYGFRNSEISAADFERERENMTSMLAEGGFWSVIAFAEAPVAELMRLDVGDSLTVQGRLKLEEYEKDGVRRVSLGVVADHALALRLAKKPRHVFADEDDPP